MLRRLEEIVGEGCRPWDLGFRMRKRIGGRREIVVVFEQDDSLTAQRPAGKQEERWGSCQLGGSGGE